MNLMVIILNKKFYALSAIKRAVKAYRGLADFKIGKGYKVVLQKVSPEVKTSIEDEFANYVLAEMKNG